MSGKDWHKNRLYSFKEARPRGSTLETIVPYQLEVVCGFSISAQSVTGSVSPFDGCKLRADGLVESNQWWPQGFLYECKTQNVRGTAYKKIPCDILVNICGGAYVKPVLYVVSGWFFSQDPAGIRSLSWMRQQVDRERLLGVLTLDEFLAWCERTQGRTAP